MPFNHKGEFIRHNPNPGPGPRPGPISTGSSRVRITSSADRPAQRPPQRQHSDDDDSLNGWELLIAVVLGLLAIAALLGLVWVLVVFHNWILIGLGLWAVASIRRRLR